jgi:hypothetical protein
MSTIVDILNTPSRHTIALTILYPIWLLVGHSYWDHTGH